MIYGIGTDIIEIERIKKVMLKNDKFVDRMFTEQEIEYFKKRNMNPQHVAGCFSAKEAVVKALGTGLRGFRWRDIEILRDASGKPMVALSANAKKYVEDNGIGVIYITISHSKNYATATALAEMSIEKEGLMIEDLLFQSDEGLNRNIH